MNRGIENVLLSKFFEEFLYIRVLDVKCSEILIFPRQSLLTISIPINTTSIPFQTTTSNFDQSNTMALNRYNRPFFTGFDDFFAPTPFLTRDRDFFDLMPVVPNIDRETSSLLRSSPGYEISESDDKYQIHVDVPGVKAADMNVDLENDGRVIHISGGRKIEKEGVMTETRFEKRFTIGDNVDVEKMSANLADGVLTLTAPKIEKKEKPKHTIAITEGPYQEPAKLKQVQGPPDRPSERAHSRM